MKKKIVFISESVGGGLRKHIVQLLRNLDKNKFELYLIHGTDNIDMSFQKEYENLKSEGTLIPCRTFTREINMVKDYQTLIFISKKLKEIKPDIVHCHSSKAGVLGRLAAKVNRIRKIYYTPHAYSFFAPEFGIMKKNIFIQIEKVMSKFTTKTFCVSNNERNEAILKKIDNPDKLIVIYNGLEKKHFPNKKELRSKLDLPIDRIIIGNCARLSNQKNPYLFMSIAKFLSKSFNNTFHFVWCGSGPLYEEVKNEIMAEKLDGIISLIGERLDSDEIVSSFDFFVSTSLYEGLPYAPIEALRAGVPLLLTDVVGNKEIIDNDSVGMLFDLENNDKFKNIANYIFKLHDSEIIKKYFETRFSLNRMINSITKEYLN